MPRRAAYPVIQPGLLTLDAARALNEALRDLQRLVGGFTVAAPLTLQEDSGGVRLGVNQNGLLSIDHNAVFVGAEPVLNFVDTGTVLFTVTNNAGATRVDVSAASSAMTGLSVYKDGSLIGSRPKLDVATGDGLTLTVTDDAGNNWVFVKEDIGGPIHTNRTLTPDAGVTLTFSGIDTSSLNRFVNATHQIATQNDLNISREPDLGPGTGGRIDNYSPTNIDPVYYFGSNMQNNSLSGWLKPANFPDGAVIWIVLTGPSDSTTLTLNHLDANSTDGNRFFCFNQANLTLARYQGAALQYDNNFGAHGVWRVLSVTSPPGGGGDPAPGNNTDILYNASGAEAADDNFTYNTSTTAVKLTSTANQSEYQAEVVLNSLFPYVTLQQKGTGGADSLAGTTAGRLRWRCREGGTLTDVCKIEGYWDGSTGNGVMFLFADGSGNPVLTLQVTGGVGGTQKLGFFASTPGGLVPPAPQQNNPGNTHTTSAGTGAAVLVDTKFDGGLGTLGYTIGDIVRALKNYNLIVN